MRSQGCGGEGGAKPIYVTQMEVCRPDDIYILYIIDVGL